MSVIRQICGILHGSYRQDNSTRAGKIRRRRLFIRLLLSTAILIFVFLVWLYSYNNISVTGDAEFGERLDTAIEKSTEWVRSHKHDILNRNNIALIRMLQDSHTLYRNNIFKDILDTSLATPSSPKCWNRLLDPNYPVQTFFVNRVVRNEVLDNKWILYAIAPDQVKLSQKQMQQFLDGDCWHGRKLTHQLWALIHLRRNIGNDEKIDKLIKHICSRLSYQLNLDIAVVDIYIQKIAFTLKAGFPKKIRKRWIERVIANQNADGGWNDRWYCFYSGRRPIFDFKPPPSNQHATIQALWLLWQVKFRYPEEFGVESEQYIHPK